MQWDNPTYNKLMPISEMSNNQMWQIQINNLTDSCRQSPKLKWGVQLFPGRPCCFRTHGIHPISHLIKIPIFLVQQFPFPTPLPSPYLATQWHSMHNCCILLSRWHSVCEKTWSWDFIRALVCFLKKMCQKEERIKMFKIEMPLLTIFEIKVRSVHCLE